MEKVGKFDNILYRAGESLKTMSFEFVGLEQLWRIRHGPCKHPAELCSGGGAVNTDTEAKLIPEQRG
jgi:hypothetical protein